MKLPAGEVARLTRLYGDAQERILLALARAEAKGNSTAHLEAVRTEVARLLADLSDGTHQWTAEAVPRAYTDGLKAAEVMLGGYGVQADLAGIHTQAAQVLADNVYSTFSAMQSSIGRQVDDQLRAYALDAITGPVFGVGTTANAKSDIFTRMVNDGQGLLRTRADGSTYLGVQITPDGKWWDMQTYAEMSARTTLAETMRTGTEMRLGESGIDLVDVVGGGGNVCDSCQAAEDNGPYSLSGNDPDHMSIAEAEATYAHLFGPNCSHSVAPNTDAFDALEGTTAQ